MKALQVYVSQLRKVLGDGATRDAPPGYVLRVEPGALDAAAVRGLLEQGAAAARRGRRRAGREVLREALGLWRGPPLAEFAYEPFARNEIGRLEELRLVALELRLEADLAVGRTPRRLPSSRRSSGSIRCASSCAGC